MAVDLAPFARMIHQADHGCQREERGEHQAADEKRDNDV